MADNLNCPNCQDPITFTDQYCNSCGDIINVFSIQESDNIQPTAIEDFFSQSDQETTIPKGSYLLKFKNNSFCDLVNENDEVICNYSKNLIGKDYNQYFYKSTIFLVVFLELAGLLLLSYFIEFMIIDFVILIFLIAFTLGNGTFYNFSIREKGIFLDNNGNEIALLSKNIFGSKYYLKTLTGKTLLLIDFKKKFHESRPTIYSFKNIYWCRELKTQFEDYSVKNGTFLLTNDVEEIAFLNPALSTIDSSVQFTGIVNRRIPQQCDLEVFNNNSNLLLVLTWAIVLVKKRYVGY